MILADQRKLAASIFRLLKVTEISFPIGRTNKGNLEIKFTTQKDDFDLILDSVPLPIASKINDENNITLKGLVEKYWFDTVKIGLEYLVDNGTTTMSVSRVFKSDFNGNRGEEITDKVSPKNKGGRPKGSRNKSKPVEDKVNG